MTTPGPRTRRRTRRVAVLRVVGFVVALALAAIAIWLIVTSSSTKSLKIGALVGVWAALIGAYAAFGSRSSRESAPQPAVSQELDLRKIGEIERAAVASARREFQAELAQMLQAAIHGPLRATVDESVRTTVQSTVQQSVQDAVVNTVRREVEAGVAQEVSVLRGEVSKLRTELLEKVGGQLRLERIETTRLIGSDIEALQHELRQLRQIGGIDGDDDGRVDGSDRRRGYGNRVGDDVHDAEIVVERVDEPRTDEPRTERVGTEDQPAPSAPAQPAQSAPPESGPAQPEAGPAPAPAAQPAAASSAPTGPVPSPPVSSAPPQPSGDPFAELPRLSPFTDPGPSRPAAASADSAAGTHRHADSDAPSAGRGGRRRRADDSDDDVLARILARERR